MNNLKILFGAVGLCAMGWTLPAYAQTCDRVCLEGIANQYRAAWAAHDPKRAPIAAKVGFTENGVSLDFPDGTWDTITKEVGPPLIFSDPKTGAVGIFTAIFQNDTPSFLAVRLKVINRKITEIEHIISTKRTVSGPPTPFGDINTYGHTPRFGEPAPAGTCGTRAQIIAQANGYFDTLQNNTGEIRGAKFAPDASRSENGGKLAGDIEHAFKLGNYRFNARVRDRDHFLVDEYRCVVMSRAFIDHKGVLDEYTLTDGTKLKSIFREPHTWAMIESFKFRDGAITDVKAVFFGAPYYMRSPWTVKWDRRAQN